MALQRPGVFLPDAASPSNKAPNGISCSGPKGTKQTPGRRGSTGAMIALWGLSIGGPENFHRLGVVRFEHLDIGDHAASASERSPERSGR